MSAYLDRPRRTEAQARAEIGRKRQHAVDVADAALIARASGFIVSRFEGRGRWIKVEAPTLAAARAVAADMGPGPFTQRPMIYALVGGRSILVSE